MNSEHRNLYPILTVVFLLLCALTAASFGVAHSSLMNNRALGWSVMIAISVAKASLVVMFFMHLWWEKSWKYVITLPVIVLATALLLLLIPDVGMRGGSYSRDRTQNAASATTATFTSSKPETHQTNQTNQ